MSFIEKKLSRIGNEAIVKENIEHLRKFENHLLYEEIADSTINVQMNILCNFAQTIDKDFQLISIEEVQNYFLSIRPTLGYKDKLCAKTIGHEKLILSKFYKFLGQEDKARLISGRKGRKNGNHKLIEHKEILTEAEVKRLVDSARNLRDKALIMFLWDCGPRIGEALNMKIGDINTSSTPNMVKLFGKTGERIIPMKFSAKIIADYINYEHPNPEPEQPLWVSKNLKRGIRKVRHQIIWEMLKDVASRAGINKRIYPHLFRHTRATEFAKRNMPSYLMNRFFGWSKDSNMASVYTHSCSKDLIEAVSRAYGDKTPIQIETSTLADVECPRCHSLNPQNYTYCSQCQMPFTLRL